MHEDKVFCNQAQSKHHYKLAQLSSPEEINCVPKPILTQVKIYQ